LLPLSISQGLISATFHLNLCYESFLGWAFMLCASRQQQQHDVLMFASREKVNFYHYLGIMCDDMQIALEKGRFITSSSLNVLCFVIIGN